MADNVLDRIASGDATAVDDCLSRYGGLVWSLARRFCANPTDAEDAVQEIFIDLWRSAGRFDADVASESTFITMVARRRLIDRQRKQARQTKTTNLDDAFGVTAAPEADRAEINEEVARVRQQMKQLRPEEQQVLELSIYQGLSQGKIAEVIDLPLGTVKTHARRGLMRLRELVGDTEKESVEGGAP